MPLPRAAACTDGVVTLSQASISTRCASVRNLHIQISKDAKASGEVKQLGMEAKHEHRQELVRFLRAH